MRINDILDAAIAHLLPEDVPVEYIIEARVTDLDGDYRVLRGVALARFMEAMDFADVADARVILDVRKIRNFMRRRVDEFFADVDANFGAAIDTIPARKPRRKR